MKHSVQFLLMGLLLRNVCVAEFVSTGAVKCTRPKGHTCVIKLLPPSDGVNIEFPDLSKRTTLRVSDGTLSNLTEALALTLSVPKLEMERLGLKSVFITPTFKELHLRDNQLTTLQTDTRSMNSFALKLLDVRKNMLKNISLLAPFDQLEELYLDDNQIHQLSMDLFARMANLRVLSASANGIIEIVPPTRKLILSKLESLSLASNRLSSIEMENWQLPSLQKLQLNNNSLVELTGMDELDQFYDLIEMKLAGNRWSCGWLQHALANVTVRKSLHGNEGVVLDADTDCSIENVLGICCSFTPISEQGEEHIFQPEIDQVRDAIRRIDLQHDAFMQYRSDKLKVMNKALQECLDKLKTGLADQVDESERGMIRATQILKKVNEINENYAKEKSHLETAKAIEQQRKHLVHFMVYMKNELLRQAIDVDRLWVQANAEKINFEQRFANAPASGS